MIRAFAYAALTYDADFSLMTNSQFRCFIGKCSSKVSTEKWRTTDRFEYLRALYQLQDVLLNVHTQNLPDDRVLYEVEYKTDRTPWQLPGLAGYVKAHQKVIIFERYNALINNGIVPVCVKVDGIEIHKNDAERALQYFDVGPNPGQWKHETIKDTRQSQIKYITRDSLDRYPQTFINYAQFNPSLIIPKLTHFSGAGGNGKTEKLIELKRVYPNLCIMAPTHEACDVIKTRAKLAGLDITVNTYHRVFGIGCWPAIPANINKFAIDECSMIPQEHLMLISESLKKHFNNTQVFGGAQIILFGDFHQLPPVSPLLPLHNTWTNEKDDLYSLFTEIELTKN